MEANEGNPGTVEIRINEIMHAREVLITENESLKDNLACLESKKTELDSSLNDSQAHYDELQNQFDSNVQLLANSNLKIDELKGETVALQEGVSEIQIGMCWS